MKNYTFCFIIVSVLLSACGNSKSVKEVNKPSEAIHVRVAPVHAEKLEYTIHASGLFTTNDETILSFKTTGLLHSLYVKEGEQIHQGQLLATLDPTEINAQVAQARLALEKAARDFKRASNLYRDSVATLEQLQNAQTGLDLAKQQMEAAAFNQAHAQIRAVSDGYVLKKFANPGQLVSSGAPVLQTNGAGKAEWILRIGISDKEWVAVHINDSAVIHTDAMPNQAIPAVVVRKSEGADPYTGSFIVELKVLEKNPSGMAAGLFGNATIFASGKNELWAIPYEALLDGNGNNGYVFVTNDGKKAHRIPVEIASLSNDRVYIRKGLENVSHLIVSGSPYLKEDAFIEITE